MKPFNKLTLLLALMVFAIAPAANATMELTPKTECEIILDKGPKDFEVKSAVVVQEADGRRCVRCLDGDIYEPVNLQGMLQSGRLTIGQSVQIKVITVDGGNVGAGSVTVIII